MMSGSSAPAGHTTMTCGSDSEQRVGAVALLAQLVDLGLAGGEALRGARARAQQRDGGRDREQDDAERERERRELVAVERREGIEIVGDRTERRHLRLGGRRSGSSVAAATTQAWSNRPRHGCVCCPHRLRIVSGISVPLPQQSRRDTARA